MHVSGHYTDKPGVLSTVHIIQTPRTINIYGKIKCDSSNLVEFQVFRVSMYSCEIISADWFVLV